MNLHTKTLIAVTALLLANPVQAVDREFFAFDNAFSEITDARQQVALLKELGYNGICSRPKNASDALFSALDEHGLEMYASYVVLPARSGPAELPGSVVEHIRKLKGRDTFIWLSLTNNKAKNEAAVRVIRQVCDLAEANGLKVVLYPHVGFCTDTVEKCAGLRELADRENLGLSFTLCHFLALEDDKKLEATIKSIAPHLRLVQINGANRIPPGKPDWKELIKPLGEGSFDVSRVLRTLDEIGYEGPVNLQCYNIDLPAREHLSGSMQAWKTLNKRQADTGKK